MFRLFKSKSKKIVPRSIELISIHIPKTAGTSFRNILKEVYGDEAVIRLDISLKTQEVRINEQLYHEENLPPETQVIHGHFSPALLIQRFVLDTTPKMITWLRHPVDRVISNFYYLEKRLKEELQEEIKGLDILSKMQRKLMEYAQDEINRNRQHKFLAGVRLEDLDFVGIQEHYSEDLKSLSHLFNWPSYQEARHNVTGGIYTQVSAQDRAEIAKLNASDIALYEEGLALRAKRIKL